MRNQKTELFPTSSVQNDRTQNQSIGKSAVEQAAIVHPNFSMVEKIERPTRL